MKYAYRSQISENIIEDGIGQMIALGVVFAREGEQDYYENEVFGNGSYNVISIKREWEDVLASAPSFEGKPIIELHPDIHTDVDINNIDEFRKGHIQNVREGTAEFEGKTIRVLKADFVFNNKETIEKVKSKELRDVSAGYFYRIDKDTLSQKDISGEHIALVPSGRAGIAKILDSDKGGLFKFNKYVDLEPEERVEMLSKIELKDLEGIKEYYSGLNDDIIEKEMVIKLMNKEINSRKTEDIIVQKANDSNSHLVEIKASDVSRGDIVHIPGFEKIDRRVTRIVKANDSVMMYDKSNNMLHKLSNDDVLSIERRKMNKAYDNDLSIREEDVVWSAEHVNDIVAGNIISNFRSNTMYLVESKDELYLYLENRDTKRDTRWPYNKDSEFDVLLDAKTHRKINLSAQKGTDSSSVKLIKDLVEGDRIFASNGDSILITSISTNENGTFKILSDNKPVYIEVEGDVEVSVDE